MNKLLTSRILHFAILFALLIGAFSMSGTEFKFRKALENMLFDQYLQFKPRPSPEQLVIIDIDDDSLARIGQWQWPRTEIAKMIDGLTALDAEVIAFDGVLAEPDRTSPKLILQGLPEDQEGLEGVREVVQSLPDNDERLAESIKNSQRFIAGFTHGQTEQKIPVKKPILAKKEEKTAFVSHAEYFKNTAAFLPELVKAAAGNGSFMAKPEDDGIIRQTGLIFSDRKNIYPSLSLEALRLYGTDGKPVYKLWKDPERLAFQDFDLPYRILIGDYKIPVDSDGLIRVYFRSFDREVDYVSAYKVIDPTFHEEIKSQIEGKIAFIGSSAEGLKDLRSSPLDLFIPGVEVHANVVEQILQGKYLYRSQTNLIAEASFILVGGFAMIALAPFISAIALLILCLQMVALAFIGSWLLFDQYGILLDPVYPSLCVFLIFVVSSLLTYIRLEADKKWIKDTLGLYISPDVMKELINDPDKLSLGGEVRDLTVMFTDIRSFTTISEALTPEQLIKLMNDFLTPMTDLVLEQGGTIDKYMGDAMMAFWNAPIDKPDHPRDACRAALGMNKILEPINDRVKEQAQKENRPFLPLAAGIGINTGPCSVGNMGSRQRFAYSCLGDAVNLASRLEGQTKSYGVSILVGEETAKHVEDFALLELDLIQVQGKQEPARVYTLIGDEKTAQTTAFKLWRQQHHDMLEAYRSGDFLEAENVLLHAKERSHLDLVDYYLMMMNRIEEFQKTPPPENWGGVYIATSK